MRLRHSLFGPYDKLGLLLMAVDNVFRISLRFQIYNLKFRMLMVQIHHRALIGLSAWVISVIYEFKLASISRG